MWDNVLLIYDKYGPIPMILIIVGLFMYLRAAIMLRFFAKRYMCESMKEVYGRGVYPPSSVLDSKGKSISRQYYIGIVLSFIGGIWLVLVQ